MNLRPLGDRVIVKAVAKEEMTKSGIFLPDSAKEERADHGEVISVGPGKMMEDGSLSKMSVKVGDKILFKKYAPDEFKFENETYLVLSESDLIAVIE